MWGHETKFMAVKLKSNSYFINDISRKHTWISSWDEIGHLESRHIPFPPTASPFCSKCGSNYTITVATWSHSRFRVGCPAIHTGAVTLPTAPFTYWLFLICTARATCRLNNSIMARCFETWKFIHQCILLWIMGKMYQMENSNQTKHSLIKIIFIVLKIRSLNESCLTIQYWISSRRLTCS